MIKPIGKHLLFELYGVRKKYTAAYFEEMLIAAAKQCDATILQTHTHQFGGGGGVTGVVILAESHITFHSWPEHGYVALDVFMCGDAQPEKAQSIFEAFLSPENVVVQKIDRGIQPSLLNSVKSTNYEGGIYEI